MGTERATGIVNECFHSRQYFLRQMLQTLPAVVIVLSKTTTRPFIRAMGGNFIGPAPNPDADWDTLLAQNIRVRFLTLPNGTELSARVLFVPHASSAQPEFNARLGKIVGILQEEVAASRLMFNAATGHLSRTRGACQFCTNALYQIGKCDYESELTSLAQVPAAPGPLPLAAGPTARTAEDKVRAENAFHAQALGGFIAKAASSGVAAPAGVARAAGGALGVVQPLDVDPLTSKPLVLRGKVVTMAGPVIDQGAVYLRNGKIAAVLKTDDPAPPGFQAAPVVDTNGVIYPGLIDLHNHLAFNVIPLWEVPRKFNNRGEWRTNGDYKRNIYRPGDVLAKKPESARAVTRYVETKLLVGGVTTSQGIGKNRKDYRGIVRNFEDADDPNNLPNVANELFDLRPTTASANEFRELLGKRQAVMHHLAEGIDDLSANLFTFLKDNDLVKSSLVAIHALGLRVADFTVLANAGAKVVWSPLSNCLLYGKTLKISNLTSAGVTFGLGCDWSPSGSKNLLQEMKVARLAAANDGTPISDEDLCKAVTINGAKVAAWDRVLGTIEKDKYADVMVLSNRQADAYKNMVDATEADVRLVIVAGVPRYGDQAAMTATQTPAADLESIVVAGRTCALNLEHTLSPISGVTFAKAEQTLKTAMIDLRGWSAQRVADAFAPQSAEAPYTIELDMDHDDWMDEVQRAASGVIEPLDADGPWIAQSVPLDPLTVIDDPGYFARFDRIAPPFLSSLKDFYEHP
jgi:cytosine/adenosine deaminase-related metal-dependent hydrolase